MVGCGKEPVKKLSSSESTHLPIETTPLINLESGGEQSCTSSLLRMSQPESCFLHTERTHLFLSRFNTNFISAYCFVVQVFHRCICFT